jgi:hypothetical protein
MMPKANEIPTGEGGRLQAEALARILRQKGYGVRTANFGREGF